MKLSNFGSHFLFFTIASLWTIMMFYTIGPWLLGASLPMNSEWDLSLLMWFFVSVALIGSGLWFFIQLTYLIVGNRLVRDQKNLGQPNATDIIGFFGRLQN